MRVSTLVADLLSTSARRIPHAVATGETDPTALHSAVAGCMPSPEQLCDALGTATTMSPLYRRPLAMTLAELDLQMRQLDEEPAALLRVRQGCRATRGGAGFNVDWAQQIIAAMVPTATTFPIAAHLGSWEGPVQDTRTVAGGNRNHRVPIGSRQMRRLFDKSAHAAVNTKGSIFELLYRRFVVRLGRGQVIGAIAHRLCRLLWKILDDAVTSEERGPVVSQARSQRRAARMLRELRSLG